MTNGRPMKAAKRATGLLLLTAVLAACAPSPPAPNVAADEAMQGHTQWCGTNPPSGYCGIDDLR
jgi:hypothetical protein